MSYTNRTWYPEPPGPQDMTRVKKGDSPSESPVGPLGGSHLCVLWVSGPTCKGCRHG